LCSIVRHRALDRLRGRSGRARHDLPLDLAVEHTSISDTWDQVSTQLERDAVRAALTEAINARYHTHTGLRVITDESAPRGEGMDEGMELKPRSPSRESECRERESNPSTCSKPKRKSGRPSTKKRP
jgi:hypothetical protein